MCAQELAISQLILPNDCMTSKPDSWLENAYIYARFFGGRF